MTQHQLVIYVGGPLNATSRDVRLEVCADCGHDAVHQDVDTVRPGPRQPALGCHYGLNSEGAGIRCGCSGRPRIPTLVNDLGTGEQYRRFLCRFISESPVVPGMPDLVYERDVYLWSAFFQGIEVHPAASQYVGSAITQWWLTSLGFARTLADASPEPVAATAIAEPDVWYVATCKACDEARDPAQSALQSGVPFATLKERAEWARGHIEATGHTLVMSEEPKVKENG